MGGYRLANAGSIKREKCDTGDTSVKGETGATGVGLTTEYNVSENNDSAILPTLNITNTGNVPLNFTMNWSSNPGSGITMKYNISFNAPNPGVNSIAVTPSVTQIVTNLGVGAYEEIWLWMDFVSVGAGTNAIDVVITSSKYEP